MRKNLALHRPKMIASSHRRWVALRLLLACGAIAPFAFEGGMICYARWSHLLGRRTSIRTPVLSGVARLLRTTEAQLAIHFRRVPWRADIVIVVGIVSCITCMFLLRPRHSR